jgi:putative tricarboxylic transport membrane protein
VITDRVIVVCTIIVAVVYLVATSHIPTLEIGDPLGPKAFPRLLGIGLLIAAGLLFLETWKDRDRQKPQAAGTAARDIRHLWVLAAVVVWTAVYYLVFDKAGYVVASTVYLYALMAWFNRGKWLVNALSAVLFSASSYLLFVKLDVNLPRGILPF